MAMLVAAAVGVSGVSALDRSDRCDCLLKRERKKKKEKSEIPETTQKTARTTMGKTGGHECMLCQPCCHVTANEKQKQIWNGCKSDWDASFRTLVSPLVLMLK